MIEAMVKIENDMITIGEFQILQGNNFDDWDVYYEDRIVEFFDYLEQAIAYCMENQKK